MTHWSRFDATADRRLLKKLADGGESALAEVYDIYAERLYDYALLFTSDVHVARSIVHDALIDAARRSARMRDRRHLRPWLYAAVRRRGMAQRRDAWSAPEVPSGGGHDDAALRHAHAALSALDRTHRDALCLALRHDVDGAALAGTLGVAQRRARRRVERATARAEAEAARAVRADGDPDAAVPTATDVMRVFPAVSPPDALRDRVLHTADDPQLARYRAQIVSRGGRLIASGMPRQPDAPSQVARRYAIGSASLFAFLAIMAVGLNLIGGVGDIPNIGRPAPSWRTSPAHPPPGQSGHPTRSPGGDQPVSLPTGHSEDGNAEGHAPGSPSARPSGRTPAPHPTGGDGDKPPVTVPPSLPPLPGHGTLTVRPASISLGGDKNTASLTLAADDGPVRWTAASASSAVSLSSESGTIGAGGTTHVTVHLARNALVQLPGTTTVTVTGSGGGGGATVPVSWSISLLSR